MTSHPKGKGVKYFETMVLMSKVVKTLTWGGRSVKTYQKLREVIS